MTGAVQDLPVEPSALVVRIATEAATDVRLGFGRNANHSLFMSPL